MSRVALLLVLANLAAAQLPYPVRAVFVDVDGEPLAGVEVELTTGRRAARHRSDEHGVLQATAMHTPAPWDLRASYPGLAELEGRLPEPVGEELGDPGEVDLGRVVLGPAGVLTGRVVRPDWDMVGGPWQVWAAVDPAGPLDPVVRRLGELDRETGEFRLEGVSPARRISRTLRLLDPAGRRVPDARVRVGLRDVPTPPELAVVMRTDESGELELTRSPSTLRLEVDGFAVEELPYSAELPEVVEVRLRR